MGKEKGKRKRKEGREKGKRKKEKEFAKLGREYYLCPLAFSSRSVHPFAYSSRSSWPLALRPNLTH